MSDFSEASAVEAIRTGCNASEVHFACSYPTCTCKSIPTAIRAALKPFMRDGWQDMATAPKDGTPLLLFARYINAEAPVRVVGHYSGEEFGWIAVSFVPHGPMQIVPQAWMLLPDFPASPSPPDVKEGGT